MVIPTQNDEVRRVYIRCRLGKGELNRLFSLTSEGIDAASTSVSTQRDSTRYSAGTLNDLIEHVRNSNASGNLDVWDNLMLEAANNTGDRKVSINIDNERVEVQLSGIDATWVHGQAARIELFLKGAGGQKKNEVTSKKLRKEIPLALLGLIPPGAMLLGIYAVAPQTMKSTQSAEDKNAQLLGMFAGLIPAVLLLGIGFWIVRRANRAILAPTSEIPHGSWWFRASSADKIALGGLITATLSFFVALAALGSDLLK
ncbi:hypothetical protein ABZ519_30575 [Streptomyces collinus]|uniref:hypothetical protein n=1 Tax=Streptomyces collinus TaxID=42684 RepID=UPI0033C6E2F9